MARFVIRADGSLEYLPREYRGEPQDYYASKIRQLRARQRPGSVQSRRQRLRALETDLLMDLELGRIRARVNRLSGKGTNDGGSERNWVAGRNLPPMRFAPRV
jgi:hypothetical protein